MQAASSHPLYATIMMMHFCPRCSAAISPEMNFCPHCGKKFKDPTPSVSLHAQTLVYLMSLFLPPLGLWYVPRYFRLGTPAGRSIGLAIIFFTLLSLGISLWATTAIFEALNQALQGVIY